LVAEGYPVQFTVLSDVNATDFVGKVNVPIFQDETAGRPAWLEMESVAVKHDTFIFTKQGTRALFWDTSARNLGNWSAEIRAAIEQLGR
jgi:hypothetical protein